MNNQKILIFRPDHLGDMLLTTPAIYALRQTYPEAHISVLAGSWTTSILKGNPDINDIITCNLPWLDRTGNPSWRPLPKAIRQIRAQKFDHIFNFRVAAKAAAFSRLLSGKKRWGFDVAKSSWAWTNTVHFDPTVHVVDNYMALMQAAGVSEAPVQFRIFPKSEDLSPVNQLLTDLPPAVVLGITSGRPDKAWMPERWASVADHIAEQGFQILLNGGPSEGAEIDAVQAHMKHQAISLIGKFSLLQFAGLLKKCRAMITIDSFPMHMAAAVEIPTIAIMGANSSQMWGPYPGTYPRIVVEPPPEIPRDDKAMATIQPSRVIEAFDSFNLSA
ncbi:MAG: heptosyltransferase-3 [Candidatus Latescibacterota bacterium]|jgi:heptosyltransferase-3